MIALEATLIVVFMFGVAVLYSSVGHAGASGYLAIMALFSVAPERMKPTALVLNIVVAAIAAARFYRTGCFSWRTFWPFAVTSVPAAFLGGTLQLPVRAFKITVGIVLAFAAVRLYLTARQGDRQVRQPPAALALPCGAGIGLLSGLVGVGGGIFLTPLLLLCRWAQTRIAAGVSATFILVNSISGLAGNLASVRVIPSEAVLWAVVVAIGGAIGSRLGSGRLPTALLREVMAVILVLAAGKLILLA